VEPAFGGLSAKCVGKVFLCLLRVLTLSSVCFSCATEFVPDCTEILWLIHGTVAALVSAGRILGKEGGVCPLVPAHVY
jgi:hypothetical protein